MPLCQKKVPDVVVARAVIPSQLIGQRGKDCSGGELEQPAIRDFIHAAAERVVELALKAVSEPLHGGELKAVVEAAGAGGELRDRAKSWIRRLEIWEGSKTARADGLIAVHLGQIGLAQRARSNILGTQTGGAAELVFDAETPLHEVGRMEFAVWDRGDGDGRKTCEEIGERRRAGKLALGKARAKHLVCGDGCVNGTAGHSGSNRCAADCA
jgi:hypothetical protein